MSTLDAYLGIPSGPADPPPAARMQVRLMREAMRRDLPGQATDSRYLQSQKFTGIPYVAIRAIYQALWRSRIRILKYTPPQDRPVMKAMMAGGAGADDEEWTPAPKGDKAVRLFDYINPVDTYQTFIAQHVIQLSLTGNSLVYAPKNRFGRPAELWVLPTALMQYVPVSGAYPNGAWRYTPWGDQWAPSLLGVGAVIPSEDVIHFRFPHPLARWDGLSPLTAMAKEIDSYDSITDARASSFAQGVSPNTLLKLKGATRDECQRVADQLTNSHGGARNNGKVVAADADDVDIELLNTTPREMDFPQSWEQSVKASLAGFGVPPTIAGLIEADSYSGAYAKRQQFNDLTLEPLCVASAAWFTKHLIWPYYGKNRRMEIELPPINDKELAMKQDGQNATQGIVTVNELRAKQNLKPWQGGDVPPTIFAAVMQGKVQQKFAPPPPPPGLTPPGLTPPGAGGGEPTPPANAAGKGSLPPRAKAFDRAGAAKRIAARALANLGNS